MADGRDDRFNGTYDYTCRFFRNACHGKGQLVVNGEKSTGNFELDSSKKNAWYCPNPQISFELDTKVETDHQVEFSVAFFGDKIKSTAAFEENIDNDENHFKTTILNGSIEVKGEIKRVSK